VVRCSLNASHGLRCSSPVMVWPLTTSYMKLKRIDKCIRDYANKGIK
jgi:hypothetical protein